MSGVYSDAFTIFSFIKILKYKYLDGLSAGLYIYFLYNNVEIVNWLLDLIKTYNKGIVVPVGTQSLWDIIIYPRIDIVLLEC